MLNPLRGILLALLLGTGSLVAQAPNIVFIFSDDHATQAISAYGGPLAEVAPTPHLDRIADEGILFERCLVTNSICGPSRATILTGKYSHLNGFMVNDGRHFDGSQQTFPKLLQGAGYQTAVIGKWHLGSRPTGFNHWEILPGQGAYYNPDFITRAGRHRELGYVTDLITDKAIDWLKVRRDHKKPFLLMVQHKAPHRSWVPALKHVNAFDDVEVPEPSTLFDQYEGRGFAAREQDMTIEKTMNLGFDLKVAPHDVDNLLANQTNKRMTKGQFAQWQKAYGPKNAAFLKAGLNGRDLVKWKYQRYIKDYLRCIKSVDEGVGALRSCLDELGLTENTVFIYCSDQGFYLGEHGWFDKRFMYDESYRTPLLVSWPGHTKGGTVNRELVSNLDLPETFLELAGVPIPSDMQGRSMVPFLTGAKPAAWRKSHYYHYYEYPGWHMVHRHEGVHDGRYKLISFYDIDEWELYDLQTDPQELKNQYTNPEYAAVRERLHQELVRQRRVLKVPANRKLDLSDINMRYHSDLKKRKLPHPLAPKNSGEKN